MAGEIVEATVASQASPARAVGEAPRRPTVDNRLNLILFAVAIGLTVVTLVCFFAPGVFYVVVAPNADQALNTAALVAAGTVAVLAWIRYRQTDEDLALLQASAFLTLFVGGLLPLALSLTGNGAYAGYERDHPGQGPMYVWTTQRLIAAVLLLLSAIAGLRHWRAPKTSGAWLILVGPAALTLSVGMLALANESLLPVLVPPALLQRILQPAMQLDLGLVSAPLAIVQLLVAAIYLAAAAAYSRVWQHGRHKGHTVLLAAALVTAAFTQLHYGIVPGAYAELLTSGDLLRLLFYLLVLAGVAAGTRSDLIDLADLAGDNVALDRLRRADARRATAEERARMAREVHDGLVQELWLARLTGGRLADMPDLPPEAKEIVARLDAVLESALGEARQAVVALQPNPDPSFGALLARFVEDYADRFGMEVNCTVEGDIGALPAEAEGDVLRVCREALANVRKHANANMVDVRLEADPGIVRLTVRDDGDGFDMARVGSGGYGLESMSQRATHIGGRLDIASAPGDGTRVTLELSVPSEER